MRARLALWALAACLASAQPAEEVRADKVDGLGPATLWGLKGGHREQSEQAVSPSSASAKAVIAEMNEARQHPAAYAARLRAWRARFEGPCVRLTRQRWFSTEEGPAAVDEAIAFLEAQQPLGPLAWSEGLARAAGDHVRDQGPTGDLGHRGSRGESSAARQARYGDVDRSSGENIAYGILTAPEEIVLQLIVDDGVPDRGHRHNLFDPRYRLAGAAMGPHAVYGTMCVIDYADGFKEK